MDFGLSKVLENGINIFYGLNSNSQILLIGHSELMLATDKVKMERELGYKVSKYTREGVDVHDRLVMIKHYFSLPNSDSVKLVIYGVDQFLFTSGGLSSHSYKLFYPFMDNRIISKYIRANASTFDYWSHKIIRTSRYTDAFVNHAIRGYLRNWDNFKIGTVNIEAIETDPTAGRRIRFDEDYIEAFEETLDLLQQKDVKVMLINTPAVDLLNNIEPQNYAEILSMFENYATQYDNVVFFDLNPEFSSDYSLFYDFIHLNRDGQKVVSEAIIRDVKSVLKHHKSQ
jgi:hypothetical protein